MPGKSQRGRGKHSTRSKKRHSTLARVAQPRAAAETYESAAPAVPLPSKPTPMAAPVAAPAGARYHYIITELRRIGILAGVMLVILVVLALVLP